jgi:hypothetical protein
MNGTLNFIEKEGACPPLSALTKSPPVTLPESKKLPTMDRASATASGSLTAMLVFVCLLIPAPGLAFDFGQAIKNAADSVKQHITDLTNKKVDEGEKQVEEGIDQTVEGKPVPSQQGGSTGGMSQQEQQTMSGAQQSNAPASQAPATAGQHPATESAVQGAQNSSETAPDTAGPIEYTGFHNSLLGFRFLPELYLSDAVLSLLTAKQIQLETQKWDEVDYKKTKFDPITKKPIGENPIPTYAFAWDDAKKDDRLREAYLRHYLGLEADWSFLSSYGYEGRLDSIVQLFLLQRDKYRDRMPEFAAQELIPGYKDFLKAVSSRMPTSYFLWAPVTLKYDLQNKEMTFTSVYTKDFPRLTKDIVGYWGTPLPPAAGGIGTIYPASLKGMQYFSPGSDARPLTRLPTTPTDMPGFYGGQSAAGGPAARWRDSIFVMGSSSDAPRVLTPRLALDRVLILKPVKMEPSRAEKILLTLKKSSYPYPNAELHFEITGAEPAEEVYRGESKGRFAVLLGKVLKLSILDGEGNPLFDVPVPLARDVAQEKEQQQAEAATQAAEQARRKETETQTEKQRLEALRMACYTGEPFPWETTSACLKAAAEKAKGLPKDSGRISPVVWEFLHSIEEDQRRISTTLRGAENKLSMGCSIGGARKANAEKLGYQEGQTLSKACKEEAPLALKAEKVCPAEEPLNKAVNSCIQNRAEMVVDKYFGFAGNQ